MLFDSFKDQDVRSAGLGEVLFDEFPYTAKLGGAPANFAFHCSQLGFASMIVSAVGHDDKGQMARQLLALNYMPALLPTVPYQTGAVQINIDRSGVPTYKFLSDTAYDHIPTSDYLLEAARKTNLVCFGTLAQRGLESRKTIMTFLALMPEERRIRLFDVNLREDFYSQEIINESLEHAEVVKFNNDELPILAGYAGVAIDPASYYAYLRQTFGLTCMIYTEGAKQSSIFLDDQISVLPTPNTDVVDTVGAGDSFGAACLCALLSGQTLTEAHEFARNVASFVCSKEGAMPEFPATFRLR